MSHVLDDLRQHGQETRALAERIRFLCGDDEQAFADTLDGIADTVEAASRVVRWMNEQAASVTAMKGLADTYSARAKVFEAREAGGRVALFHYLQQLGLPSLALPEATLSIRAGSPSLSGEGDPETLAERFVRITKAVDRKAVTDALKAGETVPGFELSNGAPTLAIRTR